MPSKRTFFDGLISTNQLAAELGVNRSTVIRWVNKGAIPYVRVGAGLIRFDLNKVIASMHHDG